MLHVARSESRADRLARAARSFAPELEVLLIPPWDCAPYNRASPSCSTVGRRVAALERLAAALSSRLVVATVETLLQTLAAALDLGRSAPGAHGRPPD